MMSKLVGNPGFAALFTDNLPSRVSRERLCRFPFKTTPGARGLSCLLPEVDSCKGSQHDTFRFPLYTGQRGNSAVTRGSRTD